MCESPGTPELGRELVCNHLTRDARAALGAAGDELFQESSERLLSK